MIVTTAHLLLGLPLVAALAMAVLPSWRQAAWLNVVASAACLCVAVVLAFGPPHEASFLLVDGLNAYLVVLTTLVATTTAWFSAGYVAVEVDGGRLDPARLRFYHTMYQGFVFALLLALLADNLGLMWVAVEGATLATVLMVSLYRTDAAVEAAWKYFILCGVGIALALFGTILMYLAAQPVMGGGLDAMSWTALVRAMPDLNGSLLNLAFVFLMVGYGTKAGLVPLHAWLPDAHAEGPTPISAVLSGLLLNVAVHALLRFKLLLAGNADAVAVGPLLAGFGAVTVLVAALMLYRRRDVKRLFAYSSIEHMGILAIAFGIGGPVASFAGLLHMGLHSLVKSAIFFAVGLACQAAGTQRLAAMGGLVTHHPVVGWGLVAGVAAILGAPPFGLFMSEFLLLTAAASTAPWAAAVLGLGLLLAAGALFLRVQSLCFGPVQGWVRPIGGPSARGALPTLWSRGWVAGPMLLHLALALIAGLWLPPALVAALQATAARLG